ncbi:unnamed protein product [Allacma fusca]|uniref:Uncharacterized protein n=1 Tax=Allacma fusca TaxID=39272 RepID=A0A8J2PRT6_9HEXA|nr:unnamed protein product [Allacma fusca]
MSKSNPYGIYENIPFVQSEKKQFSSNFNTNGIVSPTTSAGTSDLRGNICRIGSPNPTSHVPSLAGNKISDSWFSNSFVNAGGFAIKSVSEPKNDIDICQSNSRAGSVGRSGDFVNSQFSPSGRMHQAVKYRGAKTSPMSKTTDEWDFLSTLNDILRKENFLSDSDQSENKIYGGRVSNYGTSGVPENREYTPSKDISSRSMSTEPSTSLVQIPMSPRPPRPARRSDGRRKDFMKARSMNLDGVLPVNNLPSDILAPPIHFTDDDTFGAKRYDSFGKQQVHHGIPLSSHPNLPSSMPTAGSKERSPSPTHVPTMPVTKSCLSNTMSSSLDSIYDRLKSVEEYEKNYVNNTNFLPPLPFQSSKREAIGGRHLPDYPRPYNQPPISNGFNASYDNGLNSSSSTDWSHYKHLQQDFNGEMKNLDKNSMPDVSVPNYWMMPQFKSRSYGSLKVIYCQ